MNFHYNIYDSSTVHVLAHWYDEYENVEHDVRHINGIVQTMEGVKALSYWGNRLKKTGCFPLS